MMRKLPALDGLRAVAILCVTGSHVISQTIPGGFGVTLFFFISGFIITRSLLVDCHLRSFYIRRVFRLMPALLVFVALIAAVQPVVFGDIAAALMYYANFHTFTMSFDHTWSLAVEEHFYFLFPLLVLMLPVSRLQAVLLLVVAAAPIWRLVLIDLGQVERIHRATDTRFDSIAYGCLLSIMFTRPAWRSTLDALSSKKAMLIGVTVLVACFAVRNEGFRESLRYSLQGLALIPIFCGLFWSESALKWLRFALENRAMVYIGGISYSLYLYNEIGFIFVDNKYVGFLVISVPCALLSYYCIESPARRFGATVARKTGDSTASLEVK